MTRHRNQNKKITAYRIGALIIVLIVAYGTLAYAVSLWPFTNTGTRVPSTTSDSQKESDDKPTNSSDDNSPVKDTAPTNQSVAPTPVTPPTSNEPFPIENAHYKISQDGERSFRVTLFAILNHPSQYNEYRAQLKQYKQEAFDYLTGRFGSSPTLNITWEPADAQSL